MQAGAWKGSDGGVKEFRFHLTVLSSTAMLKMQPERNAYWQCQPGDPDTGVVWVFRLFFSQALLSGREKGFKKSPSL